MKRKRLLIVDDENLVVRALARLLANDFQVVTASSGDDALRCVTTGEPVDVVLSDITMPGMNGLEFALRAVEARPALRGRIVLMTGGADLQPRSRHAGTLTGRLLSYQSTVRRNPNSNGVSAVKPKRSRARVVSRARRGWPSGLVVSQAMAPR